MENSTELKQNSNSFSARLTATMKSKGISKKQLADKIKVSAQSITYYCKGERLPDVNILRDIANALEVSADYLLGLQGVPSKDLETKEISKLIGLSEKAIVVLKNEINALYELTNCNDFDSAIKAFRTFKKNLNAPDYMGIIKAAQDYGFNVNVNTKELILSNVYIFSAIINELAEYDFLSKSLWDILFLDTSKIYQVREVFEKVDKNTTIATDDNPAFYMFDRSYLKPDAIFTIKLLELMQALSERQHQIDEDNE